VFSAVTSAVAEGRAADCLCIALKDFLPTMSGPPGSISFAINRPSTTSNAPVKSSTSRLHANGGRSFGHDDSSEESAREEDELVTGFDLTRGFERCVIRLLFIFFGEEDLGGV
jgi:hypothetical protein